MPDSISPSLQTYDLQHNMISLSYQILLPNSQQGIMAVKNIQQNNNTQLATDFFHSDNQNLNIGAKKTKTNNIVIIVTFECEFGEYIMYLYDEVISDISFSFSSQQLEEYLSNTLTDELRTSAACVRLTDQLHKNTNHCTCYVIVLT